MRQGLGSFFVLSCVDVYGCSACSICLWTMCMAGAPGGSPGTSVTDSVSYRLHDGNQNGVCWKEWPALTH